MSDLTKYDYLKSTDFTKLPIIANGKSKTIYALDEEEAIMQMELLGHTFFVFKDIKTEKVNVLYKRLDGAYGVIETN